MPLSIALLSIHKPRPKSRGKFLPWQLVYSPFLGVQQRHFLTRFVSFYLARSILIIIRYEAIIIFIHQRG